MVLTNSEARKLLADFAVIGRDLLATAAAKSADIIRPDEERLRKTDDPAPKDQFVTEGGRTTTAQSGETPVLEANIPNPVPGRDQGWTIKQHPHHEFGTGAEIHGPGPDDKNVRTGADLRQHGANLADQATERARQEARDFQQETQRSDDPNEQKEAAKNGLRQRFNGMKVRLILRV